MPADCFCDAARTAAGAGFFAARVGMADLPPFLAATAEAADFFVGAPGLDAMDELAGFGRETESRFTTRSKGNCLQ
ncbi:MAG: hypothetical protein AB7K73_15655 [Gammaproteobacteria bacterium]